MRSRIVSAFAPYLSAGESEAVMQAGYKTGEPYERLYVSPINKSICKEKIAMSEKDVNSFCRMEGRNNNPVRRCALDINL